MIQTCVSEYYPIPPKGGWGVVFSSVSLHASKFTGNLLVRFGSNLMERGAMTLESPD